MTIDTIKSELEDSTGMLLEKLSELGNEMVLLVPNLVLAIIIFIVAFFCVGFLKQMIRKLVSRSTQNRTIINLAANVTAIIFSITVGLIILSVFNLNGAVNKFLATAGVLGLAVGLALQDPLTNLFSGVIMSVRNMYNIGDIVETNGYFGTINHISLRSTIIATPQGQRITIPNKDVIQNPLVNYTLSGMRRLDLVCGISYKEDLEHVKESALAAVKRVEGILENQPLKLYFTEFGDSSINFMLHMWTKFEKQSDFNEFKSNAIMSIKKMFDQEGIDIPFPIRTINFSNGLKLSETKDSSTIEEIQDAE